MFSFLVPEKATLLSHGVYTFIDSMHDEKDKHHVMMLGVKNAPFDPGGFKTIFKHLLQHHPCIFPWDPGITCYCCITWELCYRIWDPGGFSLVLQ